ncbi:hypothetical protein E1B28_013429 [Marasmius oreades]|uniref:Uncharacterized protein n=1 Tax=Marasmius oreades TaxID=181124 RepID=A0A9P7RQZ4_9AGAR|nr:uncharacterized protein E1B28_013429 [Marasmius oreades]KAG7087463.1 hypothetical protein E1B28_013429 [Marasmius oreades]
MLVQWRTTSAGRRNRTSYASTPTTSFWTKLTPRMQSNTTRHSSIPTADLLIQDEIKAVGITDTQLQVPALALKKWFQSILNKVDMVRKGVDFSLNESFVPKVTRSVLREGNA